MGTHVDAVEGYFGGYLLARAEVMAVPLALLIAVFCVDRVVGAILLVTLPLIPVFMMLVGWGAEAASRQQLQALARMGGHFADRLRGLGVIRLYGRGEAELAGIRDAAEGVRMRSLKVLRIAFLSSAVLEFFASLSVADGRGLSGPDLPGHAGPARRAAEPGHGRVLPVAGAGVLRTVAAAGGALPRPRQCAWPRWTK